MLNNLQVAVGFFMKKEKKQTSLTDKRVFETHFDSFLMGYLELFGQQCFLSHPPVGIVVPFAGNWIAELLIIVNIGSFMFDQV